MIPPLKINQLVERIGLAARQTEGVGRRVTTESIARGELPPLADPVLPPLLTPRTADAARPSILEYPLDEAANTLPRARGKITVSEKVPGWLRPFYRNQGGFNHIVLEALKKLVESNRQLQQQNQELQERVLAMGNWMNTVAETSSADHDWMTAVENRLRGEVAARMAQMEARQAALERSVSGRENSGETVGQNDPEIPSKQGSSVDGGDPSGQR